MATSHVLTSDETVIPATLNGVDQENTAPIKRGPGRPRKYPLKEGETPRPRAVKATPADDQDIQIFFATSSDDEWSRRAVYVWRYQPITHAKTGGKPTSCGQFCSKFDFDDMLKLHGSGHYRFDVVEFPADGNGKGKRIKQGFATIVNTQFPPKIGLGDWVDDPRNDAWKWAVPMLEAEAAEAAEEAEEDEDEEYEEHSSHQTADQMLETIKKGVDMFRGEDKGNSMVAQQIVALVKDNQEQMRALLDPDRQFTTMQKLLLLVAPKQDTTIVDILRDELKASRQELMEMRQEMRATNNRPLLEQLTELIPTIKQIAPLIGLGGRTAVETGVNWGEVALGVADKLSPVLTAIIERQTVVPMQQSQPGNFQPSPQATGPHGSTPQTPRPAAAPAAAAAPPPANEPMPQGVTREQVAAEQERLNQIIRKHGGVFAQVAPQLVDSYQNDTGYDFRDWLIDRKGRETWRALKSDVELPERFVALTQMSPVLRGQLRPEARLFLFAKQFLTEVGEEELIEEATEEGAAAHA